MRTTRSRFAAGRTAVPIRLLLLVLPLAAAALVLAGCGSGDDSGGAPSLEGTSWRLTGWSASSLDPTDFAITAQFDDGKIGGTSAVNTYGGPYEAGEDGSFSVGDLASTMMAGPEPDMRAETIYLQLLAEAKQYTVEGETLTLSDADGNASLIFAAGE
jgi:heat shock protein HslJ